MTLLERDPQVALLDMIGYRRPGGSKTERRWIETFLAPFGLERDAAGNLYKRVGDAPIMWSAHTDTVHSVGGQQRLSLVGDTLATFDKESNCLGADNTAGVFLLTEMLRANVPGLYVFHRGEESGGVGSGWLAENNPGLVAGIKAAIAFDRRGERSIITHQMCGRSCSDAFAKSLGAILGLGHAPDKGGTFTDTANYVELIGECSNVSVGFSNEHRQTEALAMSYLMRLRAALLKADFTALDFSRKPGEIDPIHAYSWTGATGSYRHTLLGWEDDNDWHNHKVPSRIADLLEEFPDECEDFLIDLGITCDDLRQAVLRRTGS